MANNAHVRFDPAMCVERAIASPFGADRHRDRTFHGLDDISERDFRRGPGERETAAGSAHTVQQSAAGKLPVQQVLAKINNPNQVPQAGGRGGRGG